MTELLDRGAVSHRRLLHAAQELGPRAALNLGDCFAFADWWASTAGDHLVKIRSSALDHRRFWDAMHVLDSQDLTEIERRIAARAIEAFGLDTSSLALDMTNFATFIDSTNDRAPIAQRGKAKQKRIDLRLVGLGLVITRDGGIPLLSHAYPGDRPDVTQFGKMIEELAQRHRRMSGGDPELTVVFDAGQNSQPNFALLERHRLHYVGSVPPSDHPALLTIPRHRLSAGHRVRRGHRPRNHPGRAGPFASRGYSPEWDHQQEARRSSR